MKSPKFIAILSIITFISLLIFAIGIDFIITTSNGAKLLLDSIIPISTPYKININKISGSLHKELILEDLNLFATKSNINLKIKTITIKINWPDLIKKQRLSIEIKKLFGTFNNHQLESSANFSIDFSKKQNYLYINNNSFIKIGDNILNLYQSTNNKPIDFNLTANQLEIFNEQILGKLIITGQVFNDFSKLIANIRTEKLNINNHELGQFLNDNNNHLNVIIAKQDQNNFSIETQIDFKEISYIMKFVPNITRLKGKLIGFIRISKNINDSNQQPKVSTNLLLKDITMSLPEYGIKIKPLELHFTANNSKTIFINGKGVMRNGPGEFTLKGNFEPFTPNIPNILEINGDNIECVNIPGYYIIASLQLKLALLLQQNALQVTGNITIPQGTINLDNQKSTSIVKSKDVVFVEQIQHQPLTKQNNFQILPNIDLRIEPETKLLGKGLNTTISGKLKIYTENDTLLGNGRISIKKGTYKLSGQEFIIEKGRFIYLPGTLINNPDLDIKILTKDKSEEQYLYIEGTLNDPIIKDKGLINEQQAMLQLLSFGSDKITSSIKDKLNLQEFGIHEDRSGFSKFKNKPTDESLLGSKHFVIGKKLNDKIHLQYLKTLNSTDNTVRLKYTITPHWSLGVESSTESGHGADVEFSIEK